MFYRRPTHGWWCNARTFPTRCRYCGAKVFYFSCDCGSKVFFDSLGYPWPVHECGVRIFERPLIIEEEYARRIEEKQERRRRGWVPPIRARGPQSGEIVEEFGVIREIVQKVDVFGKFDILPDSPLGAALLGDLINGDWMQATIHVDDLGGEEILSYTVLIKTEIWEEAAFQRGSLVYFVAEGREILGRQPYWLCTSMQLV